MNEAKNTQEPTKKAWSIGIVTFRKLLVKYRYKKRMSMLLKSYKETCREMAWLQDKAPKKLEMKWAFQQRRIKLYDRYLSIYGR